ncbi:hypothetical protein QOT17_011167 [Balamuthia mandrillaris]
MGRESRWTGGCAPWFVVALALSYLCLCPLCPLSEAVAQDDAEYIWLEYEYREDGELEVEPELRFRHTAKEEEGEDDEEAEQPPMWPSSFIAMGYADDWNGSSIIYYDWPNRMMRRDSLLSWPPSYWKPSRTSAGESEAHPLTQPVFTSLIWKKDHLYVLFPKETNGWSQLQCIKLHRPNSVPPPDWMRSMRPVRPHDTHPDGRQASFEHFNCKRAERWSRRSKGGRWDGVVFSMFFSLTKGFDEELDKLPLHYLTEKLHKEEKTAADAVGRAEAPPEQPKQKPPPLWLGYPGRKGFTFLSWEDDEEWGVGIDPATFDVSDMAPCSSA